MKKPFVIAVAGCSGSGKSTLSSMLLKDFQDLKVELLATDKFFNRPLPKMISPLSGLEYDDYNCPESLNFDAYLADVRKLMEREDLDLVILEGLTVLYFPELLELEDLKIFIDLDPEIRMYRRIVRNMKAGRGTMEEIADFYLNSAKYSETKFFLPTKLNADMILSGHNFDKKGIQIVESYVRARL